MLETYALIAKLRVQTKNDDHDAYVANRLGAIILISGMWFSALLVLITMSYPPLVTIHVTNV